MLSSKQSGWKWHSRSSVGGWGGEEGSSLHEKCVTIDLMGKRGFTYTIDIDKMHENILVADCPNGHAAHPKCKAVLNPLLMEYNYLGRVSDQHVVLWTHRPQFSWMVELLYRDYLKFQVLPFLHQVAPSSTYVPAPVVDSSLCLLTPYVVPQQMR